MPQVELVRGSFMDFESVERALQDCYGVYVNTDGMLIRLDTRQGWYFSTETIS